MYFVPLSHLESVELVIHSLRAAGGQAECRQCPAFRVCTKQCLTIAASIERLLQENSLPVLNGQPVSSPEKPPDPPEPPSGGAPGGKGGLKIVK